MFQYQVWKRSYDVQYLSESLIILIIAIVWIIIANLLVTTETDIDDSNDRISTLTSSGAPQDSIDLETNKLADYSENYIIYLNWLLAIGSLTFTYQIKDIQEIVYSNVRGMFINSLSSKIVLNFCNTRIMIYWLICHTAYFSGGLLEDGFTKQASKIINDMEDAKYFDIKYVLSLLIAIHLIRLVYNLQVSRTFGPMVKILVSMLLDVVVFLFLFVFLFLIFV